jgi:hypothetical protein
VIAVPIDCFSIGIKEKQSMNFLINIVRMAIPGKIYVWIEPPSAQKVFFSF